MPSGMSLPITSANSTTKTAAVSKKPDHPMLLGEFTIEKRLVPQCVVALLYGFAIAEKNSKRVEIWDIRGKEPEFINFFTTEYDICSLVFNPALGFIYVGHKNHISIYKYTFNSLFECIAVLDTRALIQKPQLGDKATVSFISSHSNNVLTLASDRYLFSLGEQSFVIIDLVTNSCYLIATPEQFQGGQVKLPEPFVLTKDMYSSFAKPYPDCMIIWNKETKRAVFAFTCYYIALDLGGFLKKPRQRLAFDMEPFWHLANGNILFLNSDNSDLTEPDSYEELFLGTMFDAQEKRKTYSLGGGISAKTVPCLIFPDKVHLLCTQDIVLPKNKMGQRLILINLKEDKCVHLGPTLEGENAFYILLNNGYALRLCPNGKAFILYYPFMNELIIKMHLQHVKAISNALLPYFMPTHLVDIMSDYLTSIFDFEKYEGLDEPHKTGC